MSWLHNFEPKDWISLGASLSALIFALVSYFQKASESKLALRKQLTDILKEITELNLKEATYRSVKNPDERPVNFGGLITDQRRYLVRQAASLAERLGGFLVNSFEYLMIAGTFDRIDYVEEAERFYSIAITQRQSKVDKGLSLRNYASYLFRQGLPEKADGMYKCAIAVFDGDNDRLRFYRGDTYIRWAESEFNATGDQRRGLFLFEEAKREFSTLSNNKRRSAELKRVEEAMRSTLFATDT